jgi:hypothetical protein
MGRLLVVEVEEGVLVGVLRWPRGQWLGYTMKYSWMIWITRKMSKRTITLVRAETNFSSHW